MNFRDAADFRLTFGKHKGRAFDEVATSDAGLRYLDWLRGEIGSKPGRLRAYEQQTLEALQIYLDDPTIARDLAQISKGRE